VLARFIEAFIESTWNGKLADGPYRDGAYAHHASSCQARLCNHAAQSRDLLKEGIKGLALQTRHISFFSASCEGCRCVRIPSICKPCRVHSTLTTIMFPITSENAASRRHSTATTMSPASIDRPPTVMEPTTQGPPRVYHPFSPAVIALLMPASVFGVLARLGLQALGTYDGKSIFPLAYPQGVGCLIMGIALPLKDTIGD
jgi:hypothetical protein